MRTVDAGPHVFEQGVTVSSLGYIPPFDRESVVTRVNINHPSSVDTWVVTVGGREIMRFDLGPLGNQQLTGLASTTNLFNRDIFTWYKAAYGEDLIIPVPRGIQIVVASVNGATADVALMGYDVTVGSIGDAMLNHYRGNRFRMPVVGYLAASVAAAGEIAFDSFIGPSWVASPFTGVPIRVGWQYQILALFIESASVNTFSGAADHVSKTDHVGVQVNGQRMFSHVLAGQVSGGVSGVTTVPTGQFVAPEGIPNISLAAANGSANTVYSRSNNPFPAFQAVQSVYANILDTPLVMRGGDNWTFYHGITGDVTGGADYSHARVVALLDVMAVGG